MFSTATTLLAFTISTVVLVVPGDMKLFLVVAPVPLVWRVWRENHQGAKR